MGLANNIALDFFLFFCRLATGGTWLAAKAQKSITSTRTTSELTPPSHLLHLHLLPSPAACRVKVAVRIRCRTRIRTRGRTRQGSQHKVKDKEEEEVEGVLQATSSLSTLSLLSEARVSPWFLLERCLQSGFRAPHRMRSTPT